MQEVLCKMSNEEDSKMQYVRQIQEQIIAILEGVKGEVGVEVPVDIEVREIDTDE